MKTATPRRPVLEAFVARNPLYAALLDSLGLRRPEDFLSLPEEIVSGHPDRRVSRVRLANGETAYLKREHVVPWRERLRNWVAGFGLASKSWREAQTLARLDGTGVGHPEWLAAGQDGQGQAFLLVRELVGQSPLPRWLRDGRDARRVALHLGQAIARLHALGLDHPDLYAGHVLIDPVSQQVAFLDWQRARRLTPSRRWRSLAALEATLPAGCASTALRLTCLRSYLMHSGQDCGRDALRGVAALVGALAEQLGRKRHIRSKRDCRDEDQTRLLLLDGGRLWLTPRAQPLWPELIDRAEVPLGGGLQPPVPVRQEIDLPDGGRGVLTRAVRRPRWWQRRPWTSPERLQMGLLFRLERRGVEAPRVLAAGEYPQPDGSVACFLLARLPEEARAGHGRLCGASGGGRS